MQHSNSKMNIRGLHSFSMIDFPGKLACVIFVGECNFRCPYCHNPCLVFDPDSQPRITETEFFNFLARRAGKLDGVVISGGEPLLQPDLLEFIMKIKDLKFQVKLDTNGSFPDKIMAIHRTAGLDALGIDYKAPLAKYQKIARCPVPDPGEKVRQVISFALANHIPLDVRTTVHKSLLSPEDLKTMRRELDEIGLREWTLQQFNPAEVIDEQLLLEPTYADRELLDLAAGLGNDVRIRGLKR